MRAVLGRVLADAVLERGLTAAHLDWLDNLDRLVDWLRQSGGGVAAAKRGARFERANPSDREGEPPGAREAVLARRRKRGLVRNQR